MKIKCISIQGFRGFNDEQTLEFDDRLTLIYAPNSCGKTSISEALEWLLYGITSKIEEGDYSKEEYKGSYRNRHFPKAKIPFVKAIFVDGSTEVEFRGELSKDDSIHRIVDGNEVEEWPLAQILSTVPRPFILQHALKRLLLTKPEQRFQGFTRLLGLEDLDQIQRDFVSLCTKPKTSIPIEVRKLRSEIDTLATRLASQSSLTAVSKSFMKKDSNKIYKTIALECKQRVPPNTDEKSVLPQLLQIRNDAISKIFGERITLHDYSNHEAQSNTEDETFLLTCITDVLIEDYLGLIELSTIQHVIDHANFFDLGIKLLHKHPEKCPFCGKSISDELSQHIQEEHKSLESERERNAALEKKREEIRKSLKQLKGKLSAYHNRHVEKVMPLLSLEPSIGKLKTILTPRHQENYNAFENTLSQFKSTKRELEKSFSKINLTLEKIEDSIAESKEKISLMKNLGEELVKHIDIARSFAQAVTNNVPAMSNVDQILKHELDTLAGTEDISVLIDLLERRQDIEKKFEIDSIMDDLKELRKVVDQFVANKVQTAISGEFTSEVMEWYGQIKTTTDPDVHFSGFDIERTKTGALKSRRVQIKATSYGQDLVSAVSSLSESKLNALGLCLSIASYLRGDSPLEFLIIDDPIQSWDAEHEIQFIEVIKKLIDHGNQVILLSHNQTWMSQVRSGCRTLNGRFYEITGYTKTGPHISEISWETWKERLREVDAIAKDQDAGRVKLQQAEQEIRIVVASITSELYLQKKHVSKSPHDLNSKKVRKMLVECGVKTELINKIIQTFETTDDAHHAPGDYASQRERLRQYHNWVYELGNLLN